MHDRDGVRPRRQAEPGPASLSRLLPSETFTYCLAPMEVCVRSRRLRAPAQDGDYLVMPALDDLGIVMEKNARQREAWQCDLLGRPLADLAASARRSVVTAARDYTQTYRSLNLPDCVEQCPIVVGGHQPELFHPGVWFKNFVLGRIQSRFEAVAINLLIDSDAATSVAVGVPGGSADAPTLTRVLLDRTMRTVPWEERPLLDRARFHEFGPRASGVLRPLVPDPILARLWPLAVSRAEQNNHLGLTVAQARHQLEAQWGLNTLELPHSSVCCFSEFHWFAAHLLAHLPRFWQCYNDALDTYRCTHHVRSRTHPVPNLAAVDHWLETPFWVWTRTDPQRRPLWASQRQGLLVLSDRNSWQVELAIDPETQGAAAQQQLADLADRGIKIRTRALITTMFARLVLSDLFVHGIGGAKYDELTDMIVRPFFGLEPPQFAVATATLRLPVPRQRPSHDQLRRLRRRLRDLQFNPDRHIDTDPLSNVQRQRVEQLVATKHRWIQTPKTVENAGRRHRAIVACNDQLQPYVASLRKQWSAEADHMRRQWRHETLLSSRTFAFCFYPERAMRALLNRLDGD